MTAKVSSRNGRTLELRAEHTDTVHTSRRREETGERRRVGVLPTHGWYYRYFHRFLNNLTTFKQIIILFWGLSVQVLEGVGAAWRGRFRTVCRVKRTSSPKFEKTIQWPTDRPTDRPTDHISINLAPHIIDRRHWFILMQCCLIQIGSI